ncbi:MAG: archaeosine biosynthesis radical SAM protein RaSEA [Thermoplasmata archaeon]|nr:archaeosine biosynthesis radical SAM protein RaSEA [Thermoplasmata archaeon]
MNDGGHAENDRMLGRPRRPASSNTPVSVWKEKENVDGKIVDAGVVILRTSGCAHSINGGCTMCGYNIESQENIDTGDLLAQFNKASADMEGISFLKLYTSGSFLDEREIPADVRNHVLTWCKDRDSRLLFESRTEFVTEEMMDAVNGIHDDLEIAVGLESSNDKVLKYAINKNMTVADYDNAADIIKKAGAKLRAYVLLKPPFLTEAEAIEDAIATAKHAALKSDTISINPVNIQRGTLVERLWKNWAYRAPWLWSVVEVLNSCADVDRKVVCDPTGGGKERGAHNCGGCDSKILESIKEHSTSQKRSKIDGPVCSCRDLWEGVVELEGLIADGTCDLQRLFRQR